MDVEKIQRINKLAIELEKQGLADGREDAVAQARRIFSVEDKTMIDANQMQAGSLQASNEMSKTSEQSQSNNNNNNNNSQLDLPQEKISEILRKNSAFLVSTIKQFQTKIEMLEQEMASIKSRIHQVASRPAPQAAVRGSEPTEPVKQTSTNPQGGDHPRSGGYNATDVSIEKFFYMGTK